MSEKGEPWSAQRLIHRGQTAGNPCMHIHTDQLCLHQDDFLRSSLPFVCCFVSVLYRHRGLDPSNTRYSKCMNPPPTTIHLSWRAGLIQFCLNADQNLWSKVQKGSFRSRITLFPGAPGLCLLYEPMYQWPGARFSVTTCCEDVRNTALPSLLLEQNAAEERTR